VKESTDKAAFSVLIKTLKKIRKSIAHSRIISEGANAPVRRNPNG
jgi:hypothetical protein